MILIFAVIIIALAFEYVNGFHDTANAIATSVSTRVMSPRQAIALATVFNLLGALAFTAVAKTIGKDLVDNHFITLNTVMCALLGAILWNLLTWWIGLPSSSSHALIGGLCGAALASAHGNWDVIFWDHYDPVKHQHTGLWPKVILPMILAPTAGLVIGFVLMGILLFCLRSARPAPVNKTFKVLQWFSSAWMSFSHGTNDAQKTMGIIALALFTASTKTEAFKDLPDWLGFMRTPKFEVAVWVKVACAIVMAAGTAAGGWRIIRTMGHHLVRMQTIHGCVAQSTAAAVIEVATHWGIPLSTTHVISGAIMGVGATKRLNAVKWSIAGRMLWAWVLTIPVCGGLAYCFVRVVHVFGMA
jgi:PiT family inorganic phosphate transporter